VSWRMCGCAILMSGFFFSSFFSSVFILDLLVAAASWPYCDRSHLEQLSRLFYDASLEVLMSVVCGMSSLCRNGWLSVAHHMEAYWNILSNYIVSFFTLILTLMLSSCVSLSRASLVGLGSGHPFEFLTFHSGW